MKSDTVDWIYITDTKNTLRYALGEKGINNIACIGVNPSTAHPNELDNTIKSVKRISEHNGYDGWVMFNLYPHISTDPDGLDKDDNDSVLMYNVKLVKQQILDLNISTIWVAWGDLIDTRGYLRVSLIRLYADLFDLNLNWISIETLTRKGHPRHPLYKNTKSNLISFNIENYVLEKCRFRIDK
jgi:hypothetical protein